MMQFKWTKQYHRSGKLASVEAAITKSSFPGLSNTHRAIILPFESGTATAYVRMNDGQSSQTCLWADKTFKSIRAAQGWARSVLERI